MTNEEFNLLPDNEKRVAIAKDVILQVENGQFIPKKGYYLYSDKLKQYFQTVDEPVSLQELIPKYDCDVCAIGAMFLSDILISNNFKTNKLSIEKEILDKKINYFTQLQLNMIEVAFECTTNICDLPERFRYTTIAKKSIDFGENYLTTFDRIIAIMQNIIKNDGEFVV